MFKFDLKNKYSSSNDILRNLTYVHEGKGHYLLNNDILHAKFIYYNHNKYILVKRYIYCDYNR